jgi:hypothetical protein
MRAIAIAAVLTVAGRAEARPPRWLDTLAAALRYEVSVAHDIDGAPTTPGATVPRFRDFGLAGAHLLGFAGTRHFVYQLGLDLAAGATTSAAGFLYDVALFPVGIGLRFGDDQLVGVGAGVGASGATGTLPAAATFPVQAIAELQLGAHLRVIARGRATWLAGAPVRDGGATIGDQLDALLALRIGQRFDENNLTSGNGYYLGATYTELEHARFVGVALGYSVDLAAASQMFR